MTHIRSTSTALTAGVSVPIGTRLQALGEQHGLPGLANIGRELVIASASFQIDKIKSILSGFIAG